MRPDANGAGLSRKAILTEIDHSLRRLGTDYVDLYQIHRWDYDTPIEETLEALHDVVKAGKARYIGASSMYAWQFAKALYLADLNGWTRFVSMQNHYNLMYREEEREMMPLCLAEGIGVIPWSPLARGRLARPWKVDDNTARSTGDVFGSTLYASTEAADRKVVDTLQSWPRERGVPAAQIALAWHLTKPYRNGANHRRNEAASHFRRGRRNGAQTYAGRSRPARSTLSAAPGLGLQVKSPPGTIITVIERTFHAILDESEHPGRARKQGREGWEAQHDNPIDSRRAEAGSGLLFGR